MSSKRMGDSFSLIPFPTLNISPSCNIMSGSHTHTHTHTHTESRIHIELQKEEWEKNKHVDTKKPTGSMTKSKEIRKC